MRSRMVTTTLGASLALALLAGCGGGNKEGVGGVTAEEAQGLNNAAEMLDASPDGLAAPADTPLGNQDDIPADAASNPDGQTPGNSS